jgi:hypothetical protein
MAMAGAQSDPTVDDQSVADVAGAQSGPTGGSRGAGGWSVLAGGSQGAKH